MTYAWRSPDGETLIEIVGSNVELPDRTVSAAWVGGLEPEERAALGFEEIVEADRPTDPALNVLGRSVADVEGVATYVWATEAKPLDQLKAEKRREAEAEYEARLAVGFPVPSLGEGETLQLRNEHDRTNWLALKDSCNDAILAGQGAQPCPLPVRTTANVNHALTFAEAADLMRDLRAWGSLMLGRFWALKEAIDAAETPEAVLAVDVTAGWPE